MFEQTCLDEKEKQAEANLQTAMKSKTPEATSLAFSCFSYFPESPREKRERAIPHFEGHSCRESSIEPPNVRRSRERNRVSTYVLSTRENEGIKLEETREREREREDRKQGKDPYSLEEFRVRRKWATGSANHACSK